MATTQDSIETTVSHLRNSQNSIFRPQSPVFSQNVEKLRHILPGFTLSASDMAPQHRYYIIHKDESFLSALSTALSVQCGIVEKDGQPKHIITNTPWATNLPPQVILVDKDLKKLNKEFILPVNVAPLRRHVDDENASGNNFIFFEGFSNTRKIGIAAAEKLILAMEYYNKHRSMNGFNGDCLTSQENSALNQEKNGLKKAVDTALAHVGEDIRLTILNSITSTSKRLEI